MTTEELNTLEHLAGKLIRQKIDEGARSAIEHLKSEELLAAEKCLLHIHRRLYEWDALLLEIRSMRGDFCSKGV